MTNKFKILLEDFNVTLTDDEDNILRKRNPAIHDGVLTRDRSQINWQEIMGYEGIMHTILNRIVLSLLGYRGRVVDYGQIGHPSRDM
jgi:hypothetical protein